MSLNNHFLIFYLFIKVVSICASKPNFIFIIADDLGWNDVGFHGSNQIPTPNIDALAYNGIILNKHYVQPTCTPSRASLMTGKYAIRTGLQGNPRAPAEPWALPIEEVTLPQRLKEHGYKTHLVGKWHLGFCKTDFTPTKRGFDSHFGYYNGWITYNESSTSSRSVSGMDARRNLDRAGDEFKGKYATDVFTEETIRIIENHNPSQPLFLELSHVGVHAERGDILKVRNEKENNKIFGYIEDPQRRLFAGILRAVDESVGKIITSLKDNNLLDNSVILFIADNGGPTRDLNTHFGNTASNWPLRGMKTSLYEGGVRGVAAIWSPLFKKTNYVSEELFHISDWLPTLVTAAGGDPYELGELDGINQWNLLIGETDKTQRAEILVNINEELYNSAVIRHGWKLIKNDENHKPSFADQHDGISGRNYSYDVQQVLSSETSKIISDQSKNLAEIFLQLREKATIGIKCEQRFMNSSIKAPDCKDCLYDLTNDPCEFQNVAEQQPDIVEKLKSRIRYFKKVMVPQSKLEVDEKANPNNWGNYWSPWLDGENSNTSSTTIYSTLATVVNFIFSKGLHFFQICRSALSFES